MEKMPNIQDLMDQLPKDDKAEDLLLRTRALDASYAATTAIVASAVQGLGMDSGSIGEAFVKLNNTLFSLHYKGEKELIATAGEEPKKEEPKSAPKIS